MRVAPSVRTRLAGTRRFAVALVVVAGCSSSPDPSALGGETTDAAEPTTEATGEPDERDADSDPPVDEAADLWAVPDEIDEDYTEAVLNEIYARHSAVARRALEREPRPAGSIELSDREIIGSLYGRPVAPQRLSELEQFARSDEVRATQLPLDTYGDRRFEVASIEAASAECIVAVGWLDLTDTAREPYPDDVMGGVVLARADGLDLDINPTGWRVHDESLLLSGGEPVPLDEIIGSDLSAVIDVDCGSGSEPRA